MAISQIPVKFIFHSYSDSSTFGTPVLGRCNLPHQMANSQIPALLWKLIYGRLSVGRSTPPSYGNFTDFCSDSSYFIPTLTAPHLADQVLVDLPPSSKAISQIPALLWEFIFGRPSVGRCTPCQMAILQISALTAHISFLLWELIIWQTRSWQIYPPSNGDFTDSCSDSSVLWELIIWLTRSWQIYLPIKQQFHRFLLYSENSYLADPLSNGDFTDSCFDSSLVWELNIWQTRSWQIYHQSNGNFTNSCSTLKAHI